MAGTLAIGLGLSACTPAPTGLSAVTSQIPSADVVALDPGAIDHALEALPAIIENALEQTGVPGAAVAVVHGDEVVFSEGYGLREAGGTETIDPETVFELASLSKPIGATVIAAQMGDGDLTWDTRIADLMPGFELADPWVSANLTLGDLYAHRSGLPHAAGDDLEDIGYDREYVLDHLWMHKLLPFRTTHKYANYSITAGAEAVAVAAGVDWSTLSEESLYAPLGMTSTSSDYADYLAQDNRASLNALVDGEFQALYERDADAQSPAGGVSSNIVDLSKWLTLMLAQGEFDGEQIVDAAALQAAMSGQIITGQPTAETRPGMYGYGFNAGVQPSGRTTASHSGAFSLGAGTNFQVVPALDLGIVVLTNGGPVGAAEAISAAFLDVVQFGEETRDWVADYAMATAGYYAPAGDLADTERPAGAAEPTELERFVGDYTNDYFGTASVALENGGLIVRLGPDGGYELPLLAWDGDTFAFVPTGENAPWGSRSSATFTETADGTTLHLQFFDSEGMGTWVR
jgi:CubicO group peptidase (beta-lactamase class C family)